MKAIEINGNIKTFRKLPNVWEDANGLHTNFKKAADPTQYGFYDVVTPQYDSISERLSAMYFDGDKFTYDVVAVDLEGTYDVLDEEGVVIETKPNYDVAELKEAIVGRIKQEVGKHLTKTDWYVTRLAERSTAIPADVAEERLDIINKSDAFEAEVASLVTVEEVMRYTFDYYPQPTLQDEPITE
jgi:hypothetical protein